MKNIFLILSFICTISIMAQSIYVDIKTTNPSPGVGDKFKISYILKLKMSGGMASISHNGIKISKPDFKDGFAILEEGNESTSFGFGSRDFEIAKYSFILQAKKKGTFELSPLTFTINGDEVQSGMFTINVETGNPNAKIETSDPNLFARIEVSKSNVYKGEAITVTYKVYTRYNGFAIEDYEMPMTNGLWKEEIKPNDKSWPQTTQTVNGMNYYVLTLKKEVVVPQKTGEIKLEAIDLKARIGRSFFNNGQEKSIKSNAPTISVKALPSPTPINFSDQVGTNYELSVDYSTSALKTNEPLDIKVTISGKGNLKQLGAPQLNLPTDFEAFDPEIKENISISTSGISGKKTFNFLVIPRYRGTFEIPTYEFTYFDINSKQYKTLTAKGQTVTVEKGENDNTTSIAQSIDKQNVEILNSDIRHIKESTTLFSEKSSLYGSFNYWILIITPILLSLLFFIYTSLKKDNKIDETILRKKQANKQATNRLKVATKLLGEQSQLAFYEELHKALINYISDKLLIPRAELTKENIEQKLIEKRVNSVNINKLTLLLDECEMARFSPTTQSGAQNTLTNATEIINQLERDVK